MTNKLYLLLLGINILIIIVNFNLLKNPKPYPPKEIAMEFRGGRERFNSYKYVGLSHYLLPRLAKSQANWINGNLYWYRSCIKLGFMGLVISLITMILGEVFNLYDWLIGLFIIQTPSILGMVYICYRMEKYILKD